MALEKLLLSLTLTMCVPGVDVRDLTETLEQIEDLMQCFESLKLDFQAGQIKNPNKKQKKETTSGTQERKKAIAVLFDLLIAQLTKS